MAPQTLEDTGRGRDLLAPHTGRYSDNQPTHTGTVEMGEPHTADRYRENESEGLCSKNIVGKAEEAKWPK